MHVAAAPSMSDPPAAAGPATHADLAALRQSVKAQQVNELPPPAAVQLLRIPEVMDDFLRNFLQRHAMTATLQAFEHEWYRQHAGRTVTSAVPMVPDNYRETMGLLNQIEVLERDLRQHAELTTRVTQQWTQAKKDRDYHRLNHQRAVQENARLSRLVKQAGLHAEQVQPTLTESRVRCEQLLKAKATLTLERDRLRRDNAQLEARVAELEAQQRQQQSASPTGASAGGSGGGGRAAAMWGPDTAANAAAAQPRPPAEQRGHDGAAASATRKTKGAASRRTAAAAAAGASGAMDDAFVWPADARPTVSSGRGGAAPSASPAALLATSAAPATDWVEQSHFEAHAMPVTSVAVHPFKPVVASGCDDGTWRLSALPGGEAIVTGQGHTDWISCVGMHPRGTMLASGSGDKTVKLWDFASNTCKLTLTAHTEAVWDLDFQDTGVLLASGGLDRTARVWDVERGLCRQTLRGHQDAVNGVRWLPCTNLLLTGSADKTVAVWDARQGTKVQSFAGHRGAVLAVAAGQAEEHGFASCDTNGAVTVWDARQMRQRLRVECGPQAANAVAMDRDGRFVAVASDDGTIKMVDLTDGVVAELAGHDGPVQSVAFDGANGSFLVSGGSDRTIRYWS